MRLGAVTRPGPGGPGWGWMALALLWWACSSPPGPAPADAQAVAQDTKTLPDGAGDASGGGLPAGVLLCSQPAAPGGGGGADLCAPCTADKAQLQVPMSDDPCTGMSPSKCPLGGPPAPGEVDPLPAPDAGCCPATVSFSESEPPLPPPSLEVEIGSWDDSVGVFTPYTDGGWAAIEVGPQGMFHVWTSLRVKLPAMTGGKRMVQVRGRGYDGCVYVAGSFISKVPLIPEPGETGRWVYANGDNPGFQTVFGYGPWHACRFCGHWLDLRVAVREEGAAAWGEGRVRIRTWLAALPKLGP